jgi:hypothetical protein
MDSADRRLRAVISLSQNHPQRSEYSNLAEMVENHQDIRERKEEFQLIGGINHYSDIVKANVFRPGIVPIENAISMAITNFRNKYKACGCWHYAHS